MTLPGTADALEYGYTLFGGVEYHDNIGLSPDNPEDEWIRQAGIGLTASEESRRLFMQVDGRLIYEDYSGDAFDDQPRSEMEARLAWRIVPDGLAWRLEGIRREELTDPTDAPTPDNLERVDLVWTGPEATLRLSNVDTLNVGARYGWIDYEEETADSERQEGRVSWVHDVNPYTAIGANYDVLTVDYQQQSSFGDFDRHDGYLSLNRETEISQFVANAGTTLISRDGRDDIQGYLAAASLRREINSSSEAYIAARHGYTDSGARLLADTDAPTWEDLPSVAVGDDLLFEYRYEIAYEKDLGAAELALRAYDIEEDFESSFLDRHIQRGLFDLRYSFSAVTRATLSLGYTEQDYLIIDRRDEDKTAALSLIRQITPRWSLLLRGTHSKRESTDPDESYEANVGLVRLRYEFRS